MTVELADPARVVIERRVEWPDTDAAGHQHHSVVMRWVEEAEAALLEPLGLSWLFGRTPRVRYQVDYQARLWFGDRVQIELAVARIGRTSLTYRFAVRAGQAPAANGEVTVVHTGTSSTGAAEWPTQTRTALAGAGRQSTTCCSVDERHNPTI